ncbi:glycosyltransferase [Photobacterium rosenbergii]|uniref:glycosyltransferase n=1 Tax=Photobacterium rosenbergii TaxID=294936 RepID=UPI001C997CEE|nr:glycosyltransferase [Photobacterium rosenbergii]MBY5947413.1 glycosyltransferase [Photobacterium rosenbergii]
MNSLFFYPWSGFQTNFLNKDVGFFPSYYTHQGKVTMLVKGKGKPFVFRNISAEFYSNLYIFGLMYFLYKIVRGDYKSLILFHIGLKNLLPVIIFNSLNKDGKIICKADLNIETAFFITKSSHSFFNSVKISLYKLMLGKIDVLLVETSNVYEVLNDNKSKLGINRLELMPNGLDDLEFDNLNIAEEKEKVITIITRFETEKKAPERLFDVINNVTVPDGWRLNLIGQIPDNINELIDVNCRKSNLTINSIGYLDRNELLHHMSQSAIFVCYSREESFCISLIEAAAFNNMIVSTNVGVAKDLSKEYSRIQIFDNYDAESFSKKISEVALNFEGDMTDESVIKKYSWRNIISRVDF